MSIDHTEVFETTGIIHQIGPTETFGENNFRVRKIVLHTDREEKWNQFPSFSANYELCDTLDRFKEGEAVEISFTLEGRADKRDAKKFWTTAKLKSIEVMGHVVDHDSERGPVTAPLTAADGNGNIENEMLGDIQQRETEEDSGVVDDEVPF